MTNKLYYKSAYIKEFESRVVSCEESKGKWLVELEEKPGDIAYAQEKVYLKTRDYIRNYLYNTDLADAIK